MQPVSGLGVLRGEIQPGTGCDRWPISMFPEVGLNITRSTLKYSTFCNFVIEQIYFALSKVNHCTLYCLDANKPINHKQRYFE